jgi:8-oxo-dGTP diphosphatase
MMTAVPGSAAVLFVNERGEVLLRLRDDRPDLPFPNQWDLIGGSIELAETAHEAALREVEEEISLRVDRLAPWGCYQGVVLVQVFVARLDTPLDEIRLLEGQRIAFFMPEAASGLALVPWVRELVKDTATRGRMVGAASAARRSRRAGGQLGPVHPASVLKPSLR